MKQIFKIVTILFFTTNVYGQINGIENLMTQRYIPCQDIRYNAQYLIPKYFYKGSNDTLNAIIDYWEKNCGLSEEISRCKIVLAISRHEFNENTYNSSILDYLTSYKNRVCTYNEFRSAHAYNNWQYCENQPDTLQNFTVCLAKKLLERNDLKPIEKFFLKMYSNDFENTFAMLQTDDFNGTLIQRLYYDEIKRHKKQLVVHGSFLLGAWVPTGNMKLLGSHLFLGVRGGVHYKRLNADITLGFKFGNSQNFYQVYKNDSIWDTDYFFGGYVGLDMGLEMFCIKNSRFDLIGGIGYDGFDALDVDDPNSNTNITKSINSLSLNIGLGYKCYINQWNYFGVDLKYNFIDYKNKQGTNLSGDAITINLIYGIYGNKYNVSRLNELDYYE